MTPVPPILTVNVDGLISHQDVRDRDAADAHSQYALASALATLIAELGVADPFVQYLLRSDIGTEVPPLVGGLIPTEYVPAQPLGTTHTVATPADLLTLDAVAG